MKSIFILLITVFLISCSKTKSDLGIKLTGDFKSNYEKTSKYFQNAYPEANLNKSAHKVWGVMIHTWNDKNLTVNIPVTKGTLFTKKTEPIITNYSHIEKVKNNHYKLNETMDLYILSETEYYITKKTPKYLIKEYFIKK